MIDMSSRAMLQSYEEELCDVSGTQCRTYAPKHCSLSYLRAMRMGGCLARSAEIAFAPTEVGQWRKLRQRALEAEVVSVSEDKSKW